MSANEVQTATAHSLSGTALAATLWHPCLGLALANAIGRVWPELWGTARLAVPCLVAAWLLIFLVSYFLQGGPAWLKVDRIMQDPATTFSEKLRGVATNWAGIGLLAIFAVYLVFMARAGVALVWP